MAYETEKNRMIEEISNTVGIVRERDGALEREATERAFEAFQQTGLNYDGPQDIIVHPPASERLSRLGAPATVGTAELATWNYLYRDPIEAAIEGLLTSKPHRDVLDNPIYRYWGFGIHTEMPDGETNELFRRWWIVIWLSTRAIDEAVVFVPDKTFSRKKVHFPAGKHWGYKFAFDGKVLSKKSLSLGRTSGASAVARGSIPNRDGLWLLIDNGHFAGMWVKEFGFLSEPDAAELS